MEDIIVACSTPIGRGAIAVIRLSGAGCIELVSKVFSPMPQQPQRTRAGVFTTKYFKDQAVCVYYKAPKSYTGEDTVEISLHGGTAVVEGALKACYACGARQAERGEFSRRAFVNGKLSLEGAEGVIEMIDAECGAAARYGYDMITSRLTAVLKGFETQLVHLSGNLEAALDYPEEDLEKELSEVSVATVKDIKESISRILKNSENAPMLKRGADIAIIGPVNAGKSSLLNALTFSDRAIVSDKAGTTRDVITAELKVRDLLFNLYDTAGIRATDDEIEAEGVNRSRRAAENCDAVIYVSETPISDEETKYLTNLGKPYILVYNKRDLRSADIAGGLNISAKEDISPLKDALVSLFPHTDGIIVLNARMLNALKKAYTFLCDAIFALENETTDIVAFHIRAALCAFAEITGEDASEKVISEVFSRFCLGK